MDAVIFDMDGVLIKSEEFYFQRRMNFFSDINETPGSTDIEDYVGKSETKIWETLLPSDQIKRKRIYNEYKIYRKNNPISFIKYIRPSVYMVIRGLYRKGIKLALASSSPMEEINKMLQECKLDSYFSYVISGHSLKYSKPYPDIYINCKTKLACDSYIAVEDSPIGIKAAKLANIYTVALKQEFYLDQSEADIIIDNLEDLLKIV